MTYYPNPEEPKMHNELGCTIVLIIAFIVLVLTLPGCQSDDQKQQYQPFHDPPARAEKAVDKIRPVIHDAAVRVDDVLVKTPVPAVTEVLVNDALDLIEKIEPLPKPTAPDPKVAEIIEPEPDPLFVVPDIEQPYEEVAEEDTSGGLSTWLVVLVGIAALVYMSFKMLKGMRNV